MKRFQKPCLIVFMIMALSCFPGVSIPHDKMTLIQGWNPWKPFTYLDENDSLTGIDVEIVHHILSLAGYAISYQESSWARQLKWIEDGTIQITASAMITSEREAYAYFSDPYYKESYILFVRQGESRNYDITSLQDIVGSSFRLGVMRGSLYGDEFVRLMEDPEFSRQVEEVTTDEQNHDKLLTHRLDGFIQEASRMSTEGKQSGISEQVEPLFVIEENYLHFMFSKKSVHPEFVAMFNEGLRKIRTDGTYQRLFEKYGLDTFNMLRDETIDSTRHME